MDSSNIISLFKKGMILYRTHLFVFLLALFIGITLAHPAILLNDEFITANQLNQLHAGEQIVTNQGKYGQSESGNMSYYFALRSNILGYPIILPLISLPAYWLIDLSGEHFVYLVITLWTVIAILLILFITRYFSEFSYIAQMKWTPFGIITIFLLFFVNLFFYAAFPVETFNNYPEIIAIVFTNMFLLAFTGMIIYEINRSIFDDPGFSFFCTMACLFSSSYFLWATHCKDHILVLPIFTGIFLCLIRYEKTDEYWYLPLAFLLTGWLAWVRPELALWNFLLVCGICSYSLYRKTFLMKDTSDFALFIITPLFTILGALPFFLNNYLITKNPLLPVQSLYLSEGTASLVTNTTQPVLRVAGVKSISTIIAMFLPKIPTSSSDLLDLVGIFFYTKTGSVSTFALVPLFLTMAIVACPLYFLKKIVFSKEERNYIIISFLVSFTVFLTYSSQIHILNADYGIIPDIRYFTPMYLPLMIIGFIVLKNINILPEISPITIKYFFWVSAIGLILSVIYLPLSYGSLISVNNVSIPLGHFFSVYILTIVCLSIVAFYYCLYKKKHYAMVRYLVFLLCSIPFFWQVNQIIIHRTFSGFAGYTFWIPITRVIWELIVNLLLLKTAIQ